MNKEPTSTQTDAIEQLRAAMTADFAPYVARIREDFRRLYKLVYLHEVTDAGLALPQGSTYDVREVAGDILRAVVDLTHAHLEDFLVTVASTFLPNTDEQTLKINDCA